MMPACQPPPLSFLTKWHYYLITPTLKRVDCLTIKIIWEFFCLSLLSVFMKQICLQFQVRAGGQTALWENWIFTVGKTDRRTKGIAQGGEVSLNSCIEKDIEWQNWVMLVFIKSYCKIFWAKWEVNGGSKKSLGSTQLPTFSRVNFINILQSAFVPIDLRWT